MPATGPPPLTPKQQHILAWLRDQPEGELTTAALAGRAATKADVMRRMLERLHGRGTVTGTGRGTQRKWRLTEKGRKEIGDREPAPIPDPTIRVYSVLRERRLGELMEEIRSLSAASNPEDPDALENLVVYVPLTELTARNTEDAYRRTVNELGEKLPAEPVLAAVSQRYWQPVPVTVSTTKTISIG